MGKGFLKINLFLGDDVLPVKNAKVLIKDTNGNILYNLISDENGLTESVSLEAPDKKNSTSPSENLPKFSVYDVEVYPVGRYKRVIVHDVQIFDTITSILPVHMYPIISGEPEDTDDEIFIPHDHGADIPRDNSGRTGYEGYNYYRPGNITVSEVALANEVRIPKYITVHLGSPNAAARNVRVAFIDYIKNVASSEIFPTWNESAIYANIYAQISFALNRIYTVWYRSRGFDFDITNSTAFDQYFVEGRDIFENIGRIVDRIFNTFIRRPGREEPLFASYCNGTTATCEGLSQWGSQDLAQRGYSPIQILRYYYPNDVNIVESNNFTEDVGTYGGVPLREGSTGEAVRMLQIYLNRISGNFYIPAVGYPDGVFGSATKNSVIEFQKINNLIPDGIVGKSTWYAITKIYVGVKNLAELNSEGVRISIGANPPTTTIQMGARGEYVVELQFLLNYISMFFPTIPFVPQNGVFQDPTKRSVVEFQKSYGLTPDGIVGPATWSKLYSVYKSLQEALPPITPPSPSIPAFPGVPLRIGSTGSDVTLMQNYLNAISRIYPSIPSITADGVFGTATQSAVMAFQRLFGLAVDGVIGQRTWYEIVEVYNNLPSGEIPQFPGTALRIGSRGNDVLIMQNYLNAIGTVFPSIPRLTADGVFGSGTQTAVIAFQTLFGLTPDGVIGRITWDAIVNTYMNLPSISAPQYPGTALRIGSRGNDVVIMQKYLNTIAGRYPSIPTLTADGVFGPATENAVKAFQRQFGLTADGVIGAITWNKIVSVYNLIISNLRVTSTHPARMLNARNPEKNSDENNMLDKYAIMLAFSMMKR